MPLGGDGGEVEHPPGPGATAGDGALAPGLTGVSIEGGDAGQGCSLPAAHAAEFWHAHDERGGDDRADAGQRHQELEAIGEIGTGPDALQDVGGELGLQPFERTDLSPHAGDDVLQPHALQEGLQADLEAVLMPKLGEEHRCEQGMTAQVEEAVVGPDLIDYLNTSSLSFVYKRRPTNGRYDANLRDAISKQVMPSHCFSNFGDAASRVVFSPAVTEMCELERREKALEKLAGGTLPQGGADSGEINAGRLNSGPPQRGSDKTMLEDDEAAGIDWNDANASSAAHRKEMKRKRDAGLL